MSPGLVRSGTCERLCFEKHSQLVYALSGHSVWSLSSCSSFDTRRLQRVRHSYASRVQLSVIRHTLQQQPQPQNPQRPASPLSQAKRPKPLQCQALAADSGSSISNSAGQQKEKLVALLLTWWYTLKPPKWLWRSSAACILGGQAIWRIITGKAHFRNTIEQLKLVGPNSLGVAALTASFVGMVFTIQFVREFAKLGLTRSVGGVLGLALSRELTPVITCIILAGRVGSAFAAELGTMQVSEQIDSLRVLGSDPVNYLVGPRVLACMLAAPALNLFCFVMGLGASVLLADTVYGIHPRVILDSAAHAVTAWDLITSMIKAWVFGVIISVVSCSWGFTTTGGAKGVGESTTSAVVISLVLIFIADFALSFLFFQGQGDALRQCAGSS